MMPQKMKGVRVDAEGFNHRPVSVMSVIARFSGYALMLLISAFIVLPFVWMFLSSVKDNNEIFVVPVQWFPKNGIGSIICRYGPRPTCGAGCLTPCSSRWW